ncbi:MAG: histidinol dehydrogenase, partial [Solirubrobacterales bacterium]|nr:histidinol dehydrogenase [Solirubrobacterales bacterium]
MRCERLTVTDDPTRTAAALRELIPTPHEVRETVGEIIEQVRAHGDEALIDYTRRFDTAGRDPEPLVVDPEAIAAAARALDPHVRHGVERAIENLEAVLAAGRSSADVAVEL